MSIEACAIFDLDKTLYQPGPDMPDFDVEMEAEKIVFISKRLGCSSDDAKKEMARLRQRYRPSGLVIGLEQAHGISREEFFNTVWDVAAERYVPEDPDLRPELEALNGRIALLTMSPKIWADRALARLNLDRDIFDGRVTTGESRLVKPSTKIFLHVATTLNAHPRTIFSVGDKESTDIVPAQRVGMHGIKIGNGKFTTAEHVFPEVKAATRFIREVKFTVL